MPQFELNAARYGRHPYYSLSDFEKGYVEAMFFTNGDTGDEREFLLNELGVERLTKEALKSIHEDCEAFCEAAGPLLDLAESIDGYSIDRAGNDFWFTRQGHGVGFWDRKELDVDVSRLADDSLAFTEETQSGDAQFIGTLAELLTDHAKAAGEAYCETARGWIYHR